MLEPLKETRSRHALPRSPHLLPLDFVSYPFTLVNALRLPRLSSLIAGRL